MRSIALLTGACSLLAGCGSQASGERDPAVAPKLPDVVGVVAGASFEHIEGFQRRDHPAGDRRPFYGGDLVLADGTVIEIDEHTAGIDGCRSQGETLIGETRYVPDFTGCLALVSVDESGAAVWVSFLDPLSERPVRWGLSSTPSVMTDEGATFPDLFGGRGAILTISDPGDDILLGAIRPAVTCEGDDGAELRQASTAFTVDDAGAIQSFVGYGDPGNPFDGPCDWNI